MTNKEYYGDTYEGELKMHKADGKGCTLLSCSHCRFASSRPENKHDKYTQNADGLYGSKARCSYRFADAPYGMPHDMRIPWPNDKETPTNNKTSENKTDHTETKEGMFNRILQRMKNRRYIGTVTREDRVPSACIIKLHDRVFATYALRHGFAELVGDDCCIGFLSSDSTKRTQPLDAGANCLIMDGICFTKNTTFGNGCLFEGHNRFNIGNHTFGDGCIFGPGCTFEGKCTFGKDCVFLCDDPTAKPKPTVLKEFFVENLDKSQRKVTITIWSDYSIQVKAGCFTGTLGEFAERADEEHKLFYYRGIPIIANTVADQLRKDRGDK